LKVIAESYISVKYITDVVTYTYRHILQNKTKPCTSSGLTNTPNNNMNTLEN